MLLFVIDGEAIGPYMPYIVGGLMAVSFFFYKGLPFIKKIQKTIAHKDFTRNPAGTSVSHEQFQALLVGAINGEQTMLYIDTLATGKPMNDMKKDMLEWWDINSRETAIDTLIWLFKSGHRIYYTTLIPVLSKSSKEQKAYIASHFEDTNKAAGYLQQISDCTADLVKEGYTQEDFARSILCWDMGRMVTVARGCYECGYISEQEAWQIIGDGYKAVKAEYANWEQFARSYIIGRCMWGGNTMALGVVKDIAQKLLTAEDSPWKSVKLH